MTTVHRMAFARQETMASLLGTLSALSVTLTGIGLFGVMSYFVAQREREIGIRIALGASRPGVVRLVLRQAAVLTGAGIALGLPAAHGATQLLQRRMLFEVSATDPASYTGTALVLTVVAAAASGLPAWRAASVDPSEALR
jgi:ABC-type antimicrobial peptide transport system permease subunit